MKIDLTSIDLDAFADLDVWFVMIALMLAFAIFMFVRHDLRRLRVTSPDPFFYPIGDVPNLPKLPAGSILEGPAERSPAESGTGYTARELYLVTRSARRAAPAGQGSGGNGKSSCGPAAAGPSGWRGQRAH
jgi:hypothetical protein